MSFTSTCHHIAFATKGRRRFLCDDVLPRTIEYIGGIIRRLDGQLLAGGGIPDHVHLVAVVPPTISLAEFVKKIKANSSRWIHQTFAQLQAFSWQDGYAAFAVSQSLASRVVEYVRNQALHHRNRMFGEELIMLLKLHKIAYDPRYVVDD